MKILADESVDNGIVQRLRRDGYDVSYAAETAIDANAELATFNVKHYRVLKGLQSVQPYER